jgi:hypothetical protein
MPKIERGVRNQAGQIVLKTSDANADTRAGSCMKCKVRMKTFTDPATGTPVTGCPRCGAKYEAKPF